MINIDGNLQSKFRRKFPRLSLSNNMKGINRIV